MILNINKATGVVHDVGQFYDPRYFDNETWPDGAIPQGKSPREFVREGGAIVPRPVIDPRGDLIARIDNLPATVSPELKSILKELVK